jgi:hypothetical protein
MNISKSNFRLYAAKHYDNPFCLNETEFDSDLYKASVIKKLVTMYVQNEHTNIKLLINTTISFFNVFDHKAAVEIIRFKMADDHVEYINSILLYLSLPLVDDGIFNNQFLIQISEEFK